MSLEPGALATLAELVAVLERLGVTCVVGGSLASGLWGEPRATNDVDVLVDLREDQIGELVRALSPAFYVVEPAVRAAVERATSFNVVHYARAHKIDVFVAGVEGLDRAQLERRVVRSLSSDSRPFAVTSPEDVVLRKLDWFRRGDESSQRQWRDVLGVLKVGGADLDRGYLREAAEREGLAELLARAFDEAGP